MLHTVIIYGKEATSSNEFITALIGLLGVLIGSVISYYFNRKLNQESSKAMIAIQRKNLIFSKLYKELLGIKLSLESLPTNCVYFNLRTGNEKFGYFYNENTTFHFYKNQYPLANFKLWYEIQKDIRKTQIPDDLRSEMDGLKEIFESYLSSLSTARESIERVIEARKKESGKSFLFDAELLYFKKEVVEIVEDNILKNHNSNISKEMREEMELVVRLIKSQPSLKEVFDKYEQMRTQVDKTLLVLEKIIKRIVDKYEFGQSI